MVPEAIVVDTRDGYTWVRGAEALFTMETASEFAAKLNGECRPGHQTYLVCEVVPALPQYQSRGRT